MDFCELERINLIDCLSVLPLEFQLSGGEGWDSIIRFNPGTFCACRKTWNSNVICYGLFVLHHLRCELVVRLVDIGDLLTITVQTVFAYCTKKSTVGALRTIYNATVQKAAGPTRTFHTIQQYKNRSQANNYPQCTCIKTIWTKTRTIHDMMLKKGYNCNQFVCDFMRWGLKISIQVTLIEWILRSVCLPSS